MAVAGVIRQAGVSEQTSCRRKKQYGRLQADQVREAMPLHDASAGPKKPVAELSLDKAISRDVAARRRHGSRRGDALRATS
jgi:hypothetical protein